LVSVLLCFDIALMCFCFKKTKLNLLYKTAQQQCNWPFRPLRP
jgi:hypothetical protein